MDVIFPERHYLGMEKSRTVLQIRLEERMNAKGAKQAPLAKSLGLSESFIRDIVRGKTKSPQASNLDILATALETTSDYLLGKTDQVGISAPAIAVPSKPITYGGKVQAGAFISVDDYFSQDDEHTRVPDFVTPHPRFPKARQYAWQVVGNSMDEVDIKDGMWVVGIESVDYIDQYREIESGQFVIVERSRNGGSERETTVKEARFYRDRMELIPRSSDPTFLSIVVPHDQEADPDQEIVKILAVVISAYRDFT